MDEKENTFLRALETSLTDIGAWTWIKRDSEKDTLQLEFEGAQLFWHDKEGNPSGQTALFFGGVRSVILLEFAGSALPEKWEKLLENDEMESLSLVPGLFRFNDLVFFEELAASAIKTKTVQGSPTFPFAAPNDILLCFKAGDAGLALVAENIKVYSQQGKVQLDEIPGLHDRWWVYWGEYCQNKKTGNEMPYDWRCEACIPAV